MQDDIANRVYPVLTYALYLKNQLKEGAELDLESEQAALKGLLGTEAAARALPDYGGDADSPRSSARRLSRTPGEQFLGVRYALTCWLDEVFILDSPWAETWALHSLEGALYGTNEANRLFWIQAQKAEGRPSSDAVEAFFLCVMLGFRGALADRPDQVQGWLQGARTMIGKKQKRQPPRIGERGEPTTNVPRLRGRSQFQQMTRLAAVFLVLVAAAGGLLMYLRRG